MNTTISQPVSVVAEAVNEEALARFKEIAKMAALNWRKSKRMLVEEMANSKPATLLAMERILAKTEGFPSTARLMRACAVRAIPEAEHLYSQQVVADWRIEKASDKAIRQIADPDFEFAVLDDKGRASLVKSKQLKRGVVLAVWDYKRGAISIEEQKKIRRKAVAASMKTSKKDEADIVQAVLVEGAPVPMYEVSIRVKGAADGDVHRYRLRRSDLQKLIGGAS